MSISGIFLAFWSKKLIFQCFQVRSDIYKKILYPLRASAPAPSKSYSVCKMGHFPVAVVFHAAVFSCKIFSRPQSIIICRLLYSPLLAVGKLLLPVLEKQMYNSKPVTCPDTWCNQVFPCEYEFWCILCNSTRALFSGGTTATTYHWAYGLNSDAGPKTIGKIYLSAVLQVETGANALTKAMTLW